VRLGAGLSMQKIWFSASPTSSKGVKGANQTNKARIPSAPVKGRPTTVSGAIRHNSAAGVGFLRGGLKAIGPPPAFASSPLRKSCQAVTRRILGTHDTPVEAPPSPSIRKRPMTVSQRSPLRKGLRNTAPVAATDPTEIQQRLTYLRSLLAGTPAPSEDDLDATMSSLDASIVQPFLASNILTTTGTVTSVLNSSSCPTTTDDGVFLTRRKSSRMRAASHVPKAPPLMRNHIHAPEGECTSVCGAKEVILHDIVVNYKASVAMDEACRHNDDMLGYVYAVCKYDEEPFRLSPSLPQDSCGPRIPGGEGDNPQTRKPTRDRNKPNFMKGRQSPVRVTSSVKPRFRLWKTMCKQRCGMCETCKATLQLLQGKEDELKPAPKPPPQPMVTLFSRKASVNPLQSYGNVMERSASLTMTATKLREQFNKTLRDQSQTLRHTSM
jgi:hypothetical protein